MPFGQSSKSRRGSLSVTVMMMAAVLASVGCDRAESPFAPEFGVEEPPRLSVSAEPPSAAELPAETTDVQPKSTPLISRVSIRPLVVVDGIMLPDDWHFSDIRNLDIEHAEIVKGAGAMKLYGPRARGGAIEIWTKQGN